MLLLTGQGCDGARLVKAGTHWANFVHTLPATYPLIMPQELT